MTKAFLATREGQWGFLWSRAQRMKGLRMQMRGPFAMEICPIVRSLFAMARTISGAAESPNPARYQTRGSDSKARSEEHTSELQSLMRISYAVFCLKKKTTTPHTNNITFYMNRLNHH